MEMLEKKLTRRFLVSTKRCLQDWLLKQTAEQIFVNLLRSEFELLPAKSRRILD